jgi:hypothetical protein
MLCTVSSLLPTLRRAAADPEMRRLQLASFAWSAGEAAYLVGLFVAAYLAAGAASVAAIAVIRTVPSVVLAPWMATVAARRAVDSAIRWSLGIRIAAVAGLAGAIAIELPLVVPAVLVAIDSVVATLLRPLRGAALPAVARTPEELVAGNVALTTGDSLAGLVGPAVAAVVLTLAGPVATFVPGILGIALALAAAARLHTSPLPRPTDARGTEQDSASGPVAAARWLAVDPVRAVVALFVIQRAARGGLTVITVAAAIDLLGMGEPGVGLLTAAMGLGGLAGGVVAVSLVGRARLAPAFATGIAIWGLGIAVIGVVPLAGFALLTLGIGGIGKVLIDVAGFSLLQRSLPNAWRTPVLGLQEGLVTAALAGGSIAASLLIGAIGIAGAVVVVGGVPVLAMLALTPWLRRVDRGAGASAEAHTLLRREALFEPLPLTALEELAAGMSWGSVEADEVIVRQGEPGDRYYLVDRGEVVVRNSDGTERRLGPGTGFGEIALLRDVPRTATVVAASDVRLAALERDRFLAAVTGNRTSARRAEQVVEGHLGRAR